MKPTSKKQLQLEVFPSLSQPFQGEKKRRPQPSGCCSKSAAVRWRLAGGSPVGVEGMWMMDGSFINKNMWI